MVKEYIEREAVFDHLAFCIMEDPETKVERVTGVVRTKDILAIPAADVVEVVRCKDCVYSKDGNCTKGEEYDDTRYRPDYFCADGYRGDNDD